MTRQEDWEQRAMPEPPVQTEYRPSYQILGLAAAGAVVWAFAIVGFLAWRRG